MDIDTRQQIVPVCPHCGDSDDDDEHKVVSEEGATMMVQCICGKTYLAEAEKITVWTTRPYPA